MRKWFQADERTEAVSGRLAVIVLGLTQIGLYLAIMIQRYMLDRPPEFYNDLAILLGISFLAFWLPCLLLGGILPALSERAAILVYTVLVLAIAVPHTIVRGWPSEWDWVKRVLIYLGLPAGMVGIYGLFAYLGKKRMEKIISADAE